MWRHKYPSPLGHDTIVFGVEGLIFQRGMKTGTALETLVPDPNLAQPFVYDLDLEEGGGLPLSITGYHFLDNFNKIPGGKFDSITMLSVHLLKFIYLST